jgi:molybdate transport system substrate-binding protein
VACCIGRPCSNGSGCWDLPQAPAQTPGGHVVVFTAASLRSALDAITEQWHKETGKIADMSYAARCTLAKQIEQGAPAQIFVSAALAGWTMRRIGI